jgi:hypothetical protein
VPRLSADDFGLTLLLVAGHGGADAPECDTRREPLPVRVLQLLGQCLDLRLTVNQVFSRHECLQFIVQRADLPVSLA